MGTVGICPCKARSGHHAVPALQVKTSPKPARAVAQTPSLIAVYLSSYALPYRTGAGSPERQPAGTGRRLRGAFGLFPA